MNHEPRQQDDATLRETLGLADNFDSAFDDADLRSLAEDIVRYCPSLTHLLLAMGKGPNPLKDLN